MILSLDQMQDLAAQCAPSVAAETLLSVVKVESGFNPLAIGVNGKPAVSVRATDLRDAVTKASALIAAGRSVDLGLGQINSRNLDWLGLSVEQAFDPCQNLAAAAIVLNDGYTRGARREGEAQSALLTALSYYNTGHPERGVRNGYVAKVTRAAATIVPAISTSAEGAGSLPAAEPAPAPPTAPSWAVFGGDASPAFVIRISSHAEQGGSE